MIAVLIPVALGAVPVTAHQMPSVQTPVRGIGIAIVSLALAAMTAIQKRRMR